MNQMRYAPAAGGLLTGIIGGAGKLIGGLFQSKATKAAIAAGKAALANPAVRTGLAVGAGTLAGQLMTGGGGGRGASGSWPHRRRGITATELRGYRKVANLIHKEGMVSKRARGRKIC